MRTRIERRPVTGDAKRAARPTREDAESGTVQRTRKLAKDQATTWRDYVVRLLHIGAEIEHVLMVQYLYAAYSLGGEQVPAERRKMVQRWQESILAIAKEEMGHLLTVQNILTLLGAPINLDREDFPWDAAYSPFPFRLEPLTMKSLSCYVYAEMPADSEFVVPKGRQLPAKYREFEEEDLKAISATVKELVTRGLPHRVGEIYEEIIEILADPERIPDSEFQEHTFSMQSSADDWGRGYHPDPRPLDAEGNLEEGQPAASASGREAHVIIDQVATRTQMLAALRALSAQGEAPHLGAEATGEPSHFERFLEIYQEFERIRGWKPSRDVPVNPTTRSVPNAGNRGAFIEAKRSRDWAELFNLRYRILLTYLAHTFRLARVTRGDEPSVRAMTMHKVFGEMYNLKTIAGILVRLPLRDAGGGAASGDAAFAGPPFEMPYNLRLPPEEGDAWRLHGELLASSTRLCTGLLRGSDRDGKRYLQTLIDLDHQSTAWIGKILDGLSSTERQRV